jgi:hypothetical protein
VIKKVIQIVFLFSFLNFGAPQLTFAQGTLNALNIAPGPGVVGITPGGVGWSFVPTTDLIVTGISATAPQVDFWLGTNQNIARYYYEDPYSNGQPSFNAGAPTNFQAISNLLLSAGQTYFISTQYTNFTRYVDTFLYSLNGTNGITAFTTSPCISQFASYLLSTNGQWSPAVTPPDNSIYAFMGPNFQFQVVPEPATAHLWATAAVVLILRRIKFRPR